MRSRTTPHDNSAAAATAVDGGDWDTAAARLCDAWHAKPSRRIAKLVADLDARVPREAGLIGKTVEARETHWVECARELDPSRLAALLGVPWPYRAAHALARLETLALWPRSARISNGLLELHRRRPYRIEERGVRMFTKQGREIAVRSFQLLMDQGDPAASAYLEELEQDSSATHERDVLASVLRLPRTREPQHAGVTRASIERIEDRLAQSGSISSALYAAVHEAPEDDAPRAVLADHLMATGDPRGEFIALQLGKTRKPQRERELLRVDEEDWLAGLTADGARDVVFRRGFPACVRAVTYSFHDVAWSTVESLILDAPHEVFTGSPTLTGVRRLYALATSQLSRVRAIGGAMERRELEVLTVDDVDGLDQPTILTARELGIGNRLTRLRFWMPRVREVARTIHELPVGRDIETLRLGIGVHEIPFAAQLLESNPRLRSIVLAGDLYRRFLVTDHVDAVLTRDRLQVHYGIDGRLFEALQRIANPPFTTIEVRCPLDAKERQAFDTIVAQWGSVAIQYVQH